jgi:hypothetical protein
LAAIESHADSDLDQTLKMLQESQNSESEIREEATALIKKANPDADTGDTNYIFLSFVINHYLIASKLATVFWGIYAINSALFANRLGLLGALIEAVNILGSFFYGTLLGIFIIAFFFKNIGGNATFIAAILAELIVVSCFFFTEIPYLWYNVIGCVVLIILAHMINPLFVAIDNNRT